MVQRLFTLAEVNAMLPSLQEQLAKLQRAGAEIERRYARLHRSKAMLERHSPGGIAGDPFFEEESALEFLRIEAELIVSNFERSGVLLKSVNPGLLDFPSVVDGEQVLICWREGEARAAYYHGWQDGYAGRKRHPEARGADE